MESVSLYVLSRVQLLATPRTAACQASLPMEFPRQGYWSGEPFPTPGDLPNPGIKPTDWQVESLPLVPPESLVSSVQSPSRIRLFATPWTAARQAFLSITNSRSLMSIELVMPSNHLILCLPSPPAFSLSQHQGLFQWVSSSHQVAKVLEFQLQYQSFQWIFRTDLL